MKRAHPRTSARRLPVAAAIAALASVGAWPAHASSHREAPAITTMPKVDATDFYMFDSYEPSRLTGAATLPAREGTITHHDAMQCSKRGLCRSFNPVGDRLLGGEIAGPQQPEAVDQLRLFEG